MGIRDGHIDNSLVNTLLVNKSGKLKKLLLRIKTPKQGEDGARRPVAIATNSCATSP